MKTVLKFLAIAAFGLPSTAWPASVGIGNGPYASAAFIGSSPDGCVNTYVFVQVYKSEILNPPGLQYLFSAANVYISQYDSCTGTQLIGAAGSADLTDTEFQVSPSVNSGALNTTVNLYDYVSDTYFDVDVNLAWASTGAPTRTSFHDFLAYPGCTRIFRGNGTFTQAVASGSVSREGTNYIQAPDEYAVLGLTRDGSVVTGCQ